MRRLFTICLLALSAIAFLASAPAASAAAQKKASKPSITRVVPMRISVGARLTIFGKNFKSKRKSNTVIFRAPDGRSAFAKPRKASRRKLVVVVPGSVARLLRGSASDPSPTRLKLRVLAGKFSAFTKRRLSPVVTGLGEGDGPGGGGKSGQPAVTVCESSADHDNDLLPNSLENQIGTDRCLADTDRDQMSDGWEYYAAKDLNVKAVPYPGQRPFPNALDPSDGGGGKTSSIDFDGDGLTTLEEYRAWRATGSAFDASKAGGLDLQSPLGYSDGTKFSRSDEVPSVPAWRSPAFGLPAPTAPFPETYDLNSDPSVWRDDERDADADGLANWFESAIGPSSPSWWEKYWGTFDPAPKAWGQEPATECGQDFGAFSQRPFAELDLADPDVDGDTLLDGEDDQDNDDFSNIVEIYETSFDLDEDGGFTCTVFDDEGEVVSTTTYPSVDRDPGPGTNRWAINPFNPCAPNPNARTCPEYRPF